MVVVVAVAVVVVAIVAVVVASTEPSSASMASCMVAVVAVTLAVVVASAVTTVVTILMADAVAVDMVVAAGRWVKKLSMSKLGVPSAVALRTLLCGAQVVPWAVLALVAGTSTRAAGRQALRA